MNNDVAKSMINPWLEQKPVPLTHHSPKRKTKGGQ